MLPSPTKFLTQLFTTLEPRPGTFDHLVLDHLCYRVATVERYESLRDELRKYNKLLVENPINGRRIATFRLAKPFIFRKRSIWLLELPEPKTGSPYPEGYEHVEFVTDRPMAGFETWLLTNLPVAPADLDRSGLHKPLNADLRLKLPDGLSVKFHELPLDRVIAQELALQSNNGSPADE